VSLTAPSGDPDALYTYATRLELAAAGASSLGTDTPTTMSSIQQNAVWTGLAATASLALGGDLGGGVADTSVPLVTIAGAVRSYAGALSNAQAKVSAYNRSATDAEVAGWSDAGTNAAMRAAASHAQTALSAWQQAGDQAASQITTATAQLGGVFATGKPVRTYLAGLPAEVNPFAAVPAGTETTGTASPLNLSGMLGKLPAAVDPLSVDGLPLTTPMPLNIAANVDGAISAEGPLALDYRTWPAQADNGSQQAAKPPKPEPIMTRWKANVSYDSKPGVERTYQHTVEKIDY
jgi:hypothetical protein